MKFFRDAISTEMMRMVKVDIPREKQPFNFEYREFHHRAASNNSIFFFFSNNNKKKKIKTSRPTDDDIVCSISITHQLDEQFKI